MASWRKVETFRFHWHLEHLPNGWILAGDILPTSRRLLGKGDKGEGWGGVGRDGARKRSYKHFLIDFDHLSCSYHDEQYSRVAAHVHNRAVYFSSVYTTQVNSAFRASWLVPQSRNIRWYSPSGGFRRKKWRASPILSEYKILNYLRFAIKLLLHILKQLFAGVSVNSGGYLPRRSGLVNIHRYSPPPRRISVNNRCNSHKRRLSRLYGR